MRTVLTLTMAILFLSGMSVMAKPGEGKKFDGKRGPGAEAKKGHAGKRAEIREKIKNMTEEERKAFFAKLKEAGKGKCKKAKGDGKKADKA